MGGLFVPQPSELPSNIRCESSDKQAIGYVGVSLNVAEYRISFLQMIYNIGFLRGIVRERKG